MPAGFLEVSTILLTVNVHTHTHTPRRSKPSLPAPEGHDALPNAQGSLVHGLACGRTHTPYLAEALALLISQVPGHLAVLQALGERTVKTHQWTQVTNRAPEERSPLCMPQRFRVTLGDPAKPPPISNVHPGKLMGFLGKDPDAGKD